jgi:exopolysaccharide biosynthesis protein
LKDNTTNRKISVAGKLTIAFIVVLQILLTSFICMMLVYYGPFNVIKKYIVGTAMSSKDHQYLATWFLSQAQIDNILAKSDNNLTQDANGVTIVNNNSKDILLYEIKSDSGKFHGYLMDVKNPKRIKVGLTSKLNVQGETTTQIALANNAVAAINGGGFHDSTKTGGNWSGTGALPTYFVIVDGKVVYNEVSNDYKFNKGKDANTSVVAFDKDGKLIIGKHSVIELLNLNVTQAIVFGRTLVVNGKPAFSGDGSGGITARTAIGQTKSGDVLLLVLDGRRIQMPGASLRDIQQIMIKYKAINAVNLDGGSSTTMFNNGKVINNPCDPLGERTIATAICVTQ